MKVWHLYKEYYLLKNDQDQLEQKLDYMALFSTNEDGSYDEKDRHIDIVYGRFTHDIIYGIKDNMRFEFAYDTDKITDVLNEKNLIKKINMIKDIPEEATTQKIIYKLEENYVTEEGLFEMYICGNRLIDINSNKKSYFEDGEVDNIVGGDNVYYPKSKITILFTVDKENFKISNDYELSMYGSYDIFKRRHRIMKSSDTHLPFSDTVEDLLTRLLSLVKFKQITYLYRTQTTEITLENNLPNIINNLACFVRDYCSESDINIAKFDKDQKEIIKLSIRIEKSNSSSTSTKDDEVKLKKILERKAKSMREEDFLGGFARAS